MPGGEHLEVNSRPATKVNSIRSYGSVSLLECGETQTRAIGKRVTLRGNVLIKR
jgi:methylase of polypeptide subunit release factors